MQPAAVTGPIDESKFDVFARFFAPVAIFLIVAAAVFMLPIDVGSGRGALVSIGDHPGGSAAADPERLVAFAASAEPGTPSALIAEGDHLIVARFEQGPEPRVPLTLELRGLRAPTAHFWLIPATTGGNAVGPAIPLTWRASKAGVAVSVPAEQAGSLVIAGQASNRSIGRLRAYVWSASDYEVSERKFERIGGVLFGSLVMLLAFSVVVSHLNKDKSFLLFAAWLACSLRISAVNAGYDASWIGIDPSLPGVPVLLQLLMAGQVLFGVTLFDTLLRLEVHRGRMSRIMQWLKAAAGSLCIAAIALSGLAFLRLVWVVGTIVMLVLMVVLIRILRTQPSTTARWYAGSWAFTYAGLVAEVLVASGVMKAPHALINSQVAVIASALLAAIALADRIRIERTGRILAQRQAIDALTRLRVTYEGVPVGLFTIENNGSVSESNAAFKEMFPLAVERAGGPLAWDELFGSGSLTRIRDELRGHATAEVEYSATRPDGRPRWYSVRAVASGLRIEGSVTEVTERKNFESRLVMMATRDPLTNLLNRRSFDERLRESLDLTRRGGVASLAYIDLNGFKLVNDLFGHLAGDAILVEVAARMRRELPEPAPIARLGGDEFVLLFNGMDLAAAQRTCRDLHFALTSATYHVEGRAFNIDASLGLVEMDSSMNAKDALGSADRACAEAKNRHGLGIVSFEKGAPQLSAFLEELHLAEQLQRAAPLDRLFLVAQPVISLIDPNAPPSYELLLRMRDEHGMIIPPSRFIVVAERNGLITDIDRWVLKRTLAWLDQHPAHRDRLGFVNVNVSGASLNDERYLTDAIGMLNDHPVSAAKLVFEITETVALYDINNSRRFVDRVRSYGARVALDDFGAGYTSFAYLKEIRADFLKIDGGFIKDIHRNPVNFTLTRAIAEFAQELGMACIAEWAEDANIVMALREIDIEYAQGYALAKPEEWAAMLLAKRSLDLVQDPALATFIDRNAGARFRRPAPAVAGTRRVPV